MFRVTIRRTLLSIAILAFWLAALRASDLTWASAAFTATMVAALLALVVGCQRNGHKRAFWLGCSLFSATYLGLSLCPATEPLLLSTRAINAMQDLRPWSEGWDLRFVADTDDDGKPDRWSIDSKGRTTVMRGGSNWVRDQNYDDAPGELRARVESQRYWAGIFSPLGAAAEYFHRISHCLLAWIAGILGGLAALVAGGTQRRSSNE